MSEDWKTFLALAAFLAFYALAFITFIFVDH